MPGTNKQVKRRNHTVNKSYLRRFANDDGELTCVELPGNKRFPISIKNATVITNFYVIRLPDGTESDEAEDFFCQIEGDAVAAISSLVDRHEWPIPDRIRTNIARRAALQYLRVPWVRQLGREIGEAFSGQGVPLRTGSGERIVLKMPAEAIDDLTGPELQIALIKRQLPTVTAMLHERDWILTFYQIKTLTTSDTPVILRPADDHPANTGVGIANAGEIHVPIDRRVALSMGLDGLGDRRLSGVTKTALYSNDAMAKNARKYIFHHPQDDPLKGLVLPKPRVRELADATSVGDLIEDAFQ